MIFGTDGAMTDFLVWPRGRVEAWRAPLGPGGIIFSPQELDIVLGGATARLYGWEALSAYGSLPVGEFDWRWDLHYLGFDAARAVARISRGVYPPRSDAGKGGGRAVQAGEGTR